MPENKDQKNFEYRHFSHSEALNYDKYLYKDLHLWYWSWKGYNDPLRSDTILLLLYDLSLFGECASYGLLSVNKKVKIRKKRKIRKEDKKGKA